MSKRIIFIENDDKTPHTMHAFQISQRGGISLRTLLVRDARRTRSGYEILQYSHCEGWVNNLYDESTNTIVFDTLEEAVAELQAEYDDWNAEIQTGVRSKEDFYDISTFQIKCIETGIVYALDLVDDKVTIIGNNCADKGINKDNISLLGQVRHYVFNNVRQIASENVVCRHVLHHPRGRHSCTTGSCGHSPYARCAGNLVKRNLR